MDEAVKKMLQDAGVDMKRTMDRFMNNEALYQKFLVRFPQDPNYAQLKAAVQAKDADVMECTAHTLKGVASNLGLDPLAKLFADIVNAVRTGELEQIPQLFSQTEQTYILFSQIIEKIS